jgi:glycosyltransferase involved in cell wall biosynthesis
MNRDKGVPELLEAFGHLAADHSEAVLLMVGPDEAGMQLAAGATERVIWTGGTPEPERYLAAGDLFVLPSHREGFGSSVIEAAATGLPAVASRIYGLTDAVVDGQTGLLFPCGDVAALEQALRALVADPVRRRSMGEAARERACREFPRERVTAELLAFYGKIRPSAKERP